MPTPFMITSCRHSRPRLAFRRELRMKESQEKRPRRWIAFLYLGLLMLVIPWYWPGGDVRQVLGFPLWSLATLGAVFATSLFTAWVYWTSDDAN